MSATRWNLPLVLGTVLLTVFLLLALLPSFMDMSPAYEVQMMTQIGGKPTWAPWEPGKLGYVLGSDPAGRDLMYRLLLGTRYTLGLAVLIMMARVVIAIPFGLAFGWLGGWAARLSSALATTFGAVPSLILFMVLLAASMPLTMALTTRVVVLVTLVGLPRLIEQVRKTTVHLKGLPHVEAAVSLGASPLRIATRHIWPLMRGDIVVTLAVEMAWVLIIMAQMAIFGIFLLTDSMAFDFEGRTFLVDGRPEWATMLALNVALIRRSWWPAIFPAIALGTAIFGFHLLAEGLRLRWAGRRA